MNIESYIQTHSGACLFLGDPDPELISLQDIAHALSQVNRYTGHARFPYSVARHSVACTVDAQDLGMSATVQRQALLHDATEAYLNDLSSPLKRLLPEYKELEAIWQAAIASRFRLPLELDRQVHDLDRRQLMREAKALLPGGPKGLGWPEDPEPGWRPAEREWQEWGWEDARDVFLAHARRLDIL